MQQVQEVRKLKLKLGLKPAIKKLPKHSSAETMSHDSDLL